MKKILSFVSLLVVIASFIQCTPSFVLDVADLPKELTFNKNAISYIQTGVETFTVTYVRDVDNNEQTVEYNNKGFANLTYQWLTVQCQKDGNYVTLIAPPNNTGADRTLYIGVTDGKNTAEIKVSQTAK